MRQTASARKVGETMMSKRRYFACVTAFGALTAVLVACTASGERTGFETENQTPADPPKTDPPPAKTSQSTPTSPTSDASVPDTSTCVTTPPSKKCGVFPQCGCTLAQTCDVMGSKGEVDCTTAGTAPMGHPCTATSGCKVGLTCMFGTCHAYCDKAGQACATAGTGNCIQVNATGGVPVPNMLVCLVKCALEDPKSCGGTTVAGTGVCFVDDKGGTDCQSGGTRTENQTCNPSMECGPALVCTGPAGQDGTCKKWCKVVCRSFSTKVMVGTQEYGACP
jgi:hypothetical protein